MSPDAVAWKMLCAVLHVPAPLRKRTWQALCRSQTSQVQTLRFNLSRLTAAPTDALAGVLLNSVLAPQAMVQLLELMVLHGHLGRRDANALQECIFASLSPEGNWR